MKKPFGESIINVVVFNLVKTLLALSLLEYRDVYREDTCPGATCLRSGKLLAILYIKSELTVKVN